MLVRVAVVTLRDVLKFFCFNKCWMDVIEDSQALLESSGCHADVAEGDQHGGSIGNSSHVFYLGPGVLVFD